MGGSTTSVEQEAALLKAALREVLEPGSEPEDAARSQGGTRRHAGSDRLREWDGGTDVHGDARLDGESDDLDPQHVPGEHPAGADSCPLCRANRLAHQVAPDLLEEVGRALDTVGRLLQDLATTVRRHTAEEHPIHRSEREDA